MMLNKRTSSSDRRRGLRFHVAAVVSALVMLVSGPRAVSASMHSTTRDDEERNTPVIRKAAQSERRIESDDYKTSIMMEKLQIARAKFTETLAAEYGTENVQLLFKTEIDGKVVPVSRIYFRDSGVSWQRLKQKVMRKILAAQIEEKPQRFVWASGGHSAAAGHGNLFNQSYTMVMGDKSKDILKAVGLDLLPRAYAMGGASEGFELAFCQKEVYGMDVDILSSDFSMITVGRPDKGAMWHYRSALLPSRPALIEFYFKFVKVSEDMEARGFTDIAVAFNEVLGPIFDFKVPDTAGKTQEEIDAMPSHVRSFRCDKTIEKGEPTCDKEKFTKSPDDSDPCDRRKYKVSWHPGWKWHAYMGNLMSSFLIEIISDALNAISTEGSDPKALMDSLKAKEDGDMKDWNAELPQVLNKHIDQIPDIPNEVIYKKQNICHLARLPAETRYNGILTESEIKGGFEPYYKEGGFESYSEGDHLTYDTGVELRSARHKNDTEKLMLSFDPGSRQSFCKNDILQIDFQDFFVANSDIKSKLILPNPSEKSFYDLKDPFHGYIAMCRASCGWGCPRDVVTKDGYVSGNVTMHINGMAVTNYTNFEDTDCVFLKHAEGHKFEPNSDGLFEITLKVNDDGLYARISSFILW